VTNRATAAQIATPRIRLELDRPGIVRHRTRAMEVADLAHVITDPNRAARAFSPASRDRLAAVRRQYDPAGLFPGLAGD